LGNSIEKDEEILNNIKAYMQENIDKGWHKFIYNDLGYEEKCIDVINAIEHLLSEYKRVLKENECLKNHVHYKNCIACGKEFRSKRDDAKYCVKCSKQIANKNYIANLTEEQKLKRREQAKLAMRKLRANRK
jgi:hypothetical protein